MGRAQAPIEVRASPIAGLGAFAAERIAMGSRIIEYRGQRITPEEADARYKDDTAAHPLVLLFTVDSHIVIDGGVSGNQARYINHSCEPNCEAVIERRRIWIYALRDIERGEELTYDYNLTGDDEIPTQTARYACRCGAASCRGTLYGLADDSGSSATVPLG